MGVFVVVLEVGDISEVDYFGVVFVVLVDCLEVVV